MNELNEIPSITQYATLCGRSATTAPDGATPNGERRPRYRATSRESGKRPGVRLVPVDVPRIEAAVREILAAVGEDPDREGLRDTPNRVARMYGELFAGLADDPSVHLRRTFAEPCEELVLLRDIDFASVCEHHLLPFIGRAHVVYLPSTRVVGLSKLARTVDAFARRPQVQERLTSQIADALVSGLDARGAVVVIEAQHFCMKIRGVNKANSVMVTSAVRGAFKNDPAARAEAMSLIARSGHA